MKPLEDKMMSIELKVRQLIQAKQQAQEHVEKLERQNQELKEKLQQKETDLQNQIKLNQFKHLATSLSNQEKKQTKHKINALVREIDYCIALLND
ncbi:MAG: hypothetical protein K9I29_06715 [Bacteroidales bacterium]|nr:hypothetical protein [Bacteroidales bacterium]MCF8327972.1 hypothetical protein [Bacteroidales bacterium]